MTWRLSKAAVQFREQVDDSYPERSRKSDGALGDLRHQSRKSDHNPDANEWVRALDITADLGVGLDETADLVNEIRQYAKRSKTKRIAYIIYRGRIASPILGWRWRKYRGNPHNHHFHISFTTLGDMDNSFFNIPMLGGTNDRLETNRRNLAKDIPSSSPSDLPSSRTGSRGDCKCGHRCDPSRDN